MPCDHARIPDTTARGQVVSIAPTRTNVVISLAAVVVVIYGMQAAAALIIPFLIATFLALITVRPMMWLQERRVPTVLAALIIVLTIMAIITVVGVVVGRSLAAFTAALPSYQEQLQDRIDVLVEFIVQFTESDQSVENIRDLINPGWAMGLAATILNALRDVLTNTLLIIFTTIFILLEASSFPTKIEAAFSKSADSLERPRQFMDDLTSYLGIKTVVSMVTGVLVWILTWSVGLDFPQLWGMLAFLLNYVPTIGSIIAAVPAVLLAVVQLGLGEATVTAIGFVTINIAFGNFIEPRLMGYGVGISPLVIFVGLFFWGWVFGPVGMLLSVPLTMSLKLALESDERTRWIAIFLGSQRDAQHAVSSRRE
jgi:predicted PurR-regulated permease PerM